MWKGALRLWLLICLLAAFGCSDSATGSAVNNGQNNGTNNPADNNPADNNPADNNPADNNPGSDMGVNNPFDPDQAFEPPPFVGDCDPNNPQCSNCIDDDQDGFIDSFDVHCISPLDDNEFGFATGIPGDNVSNNGFQDCFFDGNSGFGDDGCRIPDGCILGTEDGPRCEPSDRCIENCQPLTKPGCDCFGCCTVCVDGTCHTAVVHEALAPNCTVEEIDNPELCPPCELNDRCSTPCDNDECELCPGQTVDELPESCNEQVSCAAGLDTCDGASGCPTGFYCVLGCCNPLN